MGAIAEHRITFQALHRSGCFALPNPFDIGTAKYLQHLGFKAIATTSAGFAFSRGLADGAVGRDLMLEHIRELVGATDLPVNADFENGYADDPDGVVENVRRCVETGVAGLSIEDNSGREDKPLYELGLAAERIRAAKAAIGETTLETFRRFSSAKKLRRFTARYLAADFGARSATICSKRGSPRSGSQSTPSFRTP